MHAILPHLRRCLDKGQAAILCTIIAGSGSSPRGAGARMLICGAERIGTIGGGQLEGETIAKAEEMLAEGGPSCAVLDFDLATSGEDGMICGGAVQVLLQRLDKDDATLSLFDGLDEALARGESPVLLTLLPEGGEVRLLLASPGEDDPALPPQLRDELHQRLGNSRQPFLLSSGATRLHVERITSPIRLHLAGAGHVSLATAQLADFLGLAIVVLDDRAEFANALRFPMARQIRVIDSFRNCLENLHANDYVVIATRGHHHDRQVLAQALHSGAGYIGMIASRSKKEAVFASLLREGYGEKDLQRVHCPIGLPIGGDSPREIALSIMAEIQQYRYAKAC